MKQVYEYLFDLISRSEPMSDDDINSLYRYAFGNRQHGLHDFALIVSFDRFRDTYREVEKDVIACTVD